MIWRIFLTSASPTLSDMEQGKQRPNLDQIVSLSLIYGRSFESFFEEVMTERQKYLLERLPTLPDLAQETADTFNRPASLAKLKRRLESSLHHGEA